MVRNTLRLFFGRKHVPVGKTGLVIAVGLLLQGYNLLTGEDREHLVPVFLNGVTVLLISGRVILLEPLLDPLETFTLFFPILALLGYFLGLPGVIILPEPPFTSLLAEILIGDRGKPLRFREIGRAHV